MNFWTALKLAAQIAEPKARAALVDRHMPALLLTMRQEFPEEDPADLRAFSERAIDRFLEHIT